MLALRNNNYAGDVESLVVKMSNTALANVSTYKYLGVDLDRNLSYENAVHNTYLKANKKLFTLRKIRPYLSQEVSALIYKQYILPILDYAAFLFESATKQELKSLDKVQNRAVRLIGRGHQENERIENIYSIEPLKDRRRKHHLALMYRLSRIERYLQTSIHVLFFHQEIEEGRSIRPSPTTERIPLSFIMKTKWGKVSLYIIYLFK